jgi:type VI secretion system protein ImpG
MIWAADSAVDTRLLDAYERELLHVQEMSAEFAAEYPKIAAGLGLPGLKDPFVERLLESFAFLAARIQLKLDARHPEFTQHLLEVVYPGFLNPIPSCCIAEFVPDAKGGSLQAGVRVPRGSTILAQPGRDSRTVCQFRTAHEVVLWPLELREVQYLSGAGSLSTLGISGTAAASAALRLRLTAAAGIELAQLPVDELTFFIKPTSQLSVRLHEQVVSDCVGAAARGAGESGKFVYLPRSSVCPVGLEDDESLLPPVQSGFQGYRLLQEYFAFPERLLFFRVTGLRAAFAAARGPALDIFVLFAGEERELRSALDATHVRLYCSPAINLFPRSVDRVHVTMQATELHVPVDRNRPMDFELHSITRMRGISDAGEMLAEVPPLYNVRHASGAAGEGMFYVLQRRARLKSLRQQQLGTRTRYLGSEVFISIVDRRGRQFSGELRQLDADVLCTNRDLAMFISPGKIKTDFEFEGAAPVSAIRCLVGPTDPRDSPAVGDTAWRLLSHLSLNYLSLTETDPESGAQLLRELLGLYANPDDAGALSQVRGVGRIRYEPVVRRIPAMGPIAYGRGLEITLGLDDQAFAGTGIVALGLVLERFFARYSSINSFTQLCLESLSRGRVMRWPPRVGRRQVL